MILNDTSFSNGNFKFLGYTSTAAEHAYRGTKVGCIGLFTQALTTGEITSITRWGLERLGRY